MFTLVTCITHHRTTLKRRIYLVFAFIKVMEDLDIFSVQENSTTQRFSVYLIFCFLGLIDSVKHFNSVTENISLQWSSPPSWTSLLCSMSWTLLPSSGQLYELLLSLRRSREAGLLSVSSTSLSHCLWRKGSVQLDFNLMRTASHLNLHNCILWGNSDLN